MLFVFRGIHSFQVILALISMGLALACVVLLKLYADGGSKALMVPAVILGLFFLWGFATCLRAPTSFVAIADNRTRIRFAGFVDTVVDNRNILGARIVNHAIYKGMGVRTNFGGLVTLSSSHGPVCELTLAEPIRVWFIPKIFPVKARILRVSVRNPEKMVDRFGPPPAAGAAKSSPATGAARKMKQQRRR